MDAVIDSRKAEPDEALNPSKVHRIKDESGAAKSRIGDSTKEKRPATKGTYTNTNPNIFMSSSVVDVILRLMLFPNNTFTFTISNQVMRYSWTLISLDLHGKNYQFYNCS